MATSCACMRGLFPAPNFHRGERAYLKMHNNGIPTDCAVEVPRG